MVSKLFYEWQGAFILPGYQFGTIHKSKNYLLALFKKKSYTICKMA